MKPKTLKITLEFKESLLGTMPADPDIYREYIASNAPDAGTIEDEVAALGAEAVEERGMTVFARDDADQPCIYDYHVKGFFKDACSMCRRMPGSESKKLKAHKKVIDGVIFAEPRMLRLVPPGGGEFEGELGTLQRPLRASTAQGERVALAMSETVPAGTTVDVDVTLMDPALEGVLTEWLDYGQLRGLGQWRNSGMGRFTWSLRE